MKLREYIDKITKVITNHRSERDVLEAIADGDSKKDPVKVKDEYDRAVGFVKEALAANKNLLGIFDDAPVPMKDELLEREIAKNDLERHVLKLRHDLRGRAPQLGNEEDPDQNRETCNRIIFRILVDINNALLGSEKKIGEIFGKTEEVMYRTEFEKTKPVPRPEPAYPPAPVFVPAPRPATRDAIAPPPPKREKKIKFPPQRAPQIRPPRTIPISGMHNNGAAPRPDMVDNRLPDIADIKETAHVPALPLDKISRPPSEQPIPSADKLEEMTRRAIEDRREVIRQGLSEEDRKRILEIEAKLRAEGKIQ